MNLAAVWEMLVTFEWRRFLWGIAHAHWANVWASISAIFTALAVVVAWWAMLRWRKQDELKAKMNFKTAIGEYLVSCVSFSVLNMHDANDDRIPDNREKAYDDYAACRHAWWMLEGLLDDDKEIKDAWDYINVNHTKFMNRQIKDEDLFSNCRIILRKKIVFK